MDNPKTQQTPNAHSQQLMENNPNKRAAPPCTPHSTAAVTAHSILSAGKALLQLIRLLLLASSVGVRLVEVYAETMPQRQALYDFYWSTNKSVTGWKNSCRAGWELLTVGGGPPTNGFCDSNSGTPYSTYYGITCSGFNGGITKLDLRNCSLNGTLSSTMNTLVELTQLNLNENQLFGTLPEAWSVMAGLQNSVCTTTN